MTIQPFDRKVVIRPTPSAAAQTSSGLYLGDPDTTASLRWGTVEAIGEQVQHVTVGDVVLFNILLGREVGEVYVVPEQACLLTR